MKILILDDGDSRIIEFQKLLSTCQLTIVKTAQDAINALKNDTFEYVFLDHDLEDDSRYPMPIDHPNTGSEVARFLEKNPTLIPENVVTHSLNKEGRKNIVRLIPKATECPNAWLDIQVIDIPDKKVHKISWKETEQIVALLPKFKGKIWGIPTSGSIIAGLYCQINGLKFGNSIEDSDIIIDDTVYRGRIYDKYKDIIDSKIFMAPIWYENKRNPPILVNNINKFCVFKNPKNILLFPWENLSSVRRKMIILKY